MTKYKDTELLVNADGSIYHIHLRPDQLADNIILVGDPDRVPIISKYFDSIEWKVRNREIHSHTGYVGAKRLSVISSGMGTDNIDIIIHELDALVNIDLKTRERKNELKKLNIIRLGTTGAIQPDIPVNTLILSEYGLGIDGLLNFYKDNDNLLEYDLSDSFIDHTGWPEPLPKPYASKGSESLINRIGDGLTRGITITAPGFYGPQARTLRIKGAFPDEYKKIETFTYNNLRVTNFEMETSALYGLSRLLGHEAMTICVAIANRATKEYNGNYGAAVEHMIQTFLERFCNRI